MKCPLFKTECVQEKCPLVIMLEISDMTGCPLELFPALIKGAMGDLAKDLDKSLDVKTKRVIFDLLGLPRKF